MLYNISIMLKNNFTNNWFHSDQLATHLKSKETNSTPYLQNKNKLMIQIRNKINLDTNYQCGFFFAMPIISVFHMNNVPSRRK